MRVHEPLIFLVVDLEGDERFQAEVTWNPDSGHFAPAKHLLTRLGRIDRVKWQTKQDIVGVYGMALTGETDAPVTRLGSGYMMRVEDLPQVVWDALLAAVPGGSIR